MFVCLFVWLNKTRTVKPPRRTYWYACMLVCLGFIHTLEIIARILNYGVNRDRLCDTNAIILGDFHKVDGCQAP